MENKKVIMKCCICGRVKMDGGWEYQFREPGNVNLCSHGFCTVCYELEIKKIRMASSAVVPTPCPSSGRLQEVETKVGQADLPAFASYQ